MSTPAQLPDVLAGKIAAYELTFPVTDAISRDLLAQLASAQLRLERAAQLEALALANEPTLEQFSQLAALERYRKSAEASYHRAYRLLTKRSAAVPTEQLAPEPEEKKNRTNPTTYVRPGPKVGRNEPCPCQSGRKYKVCCLNRRSIAA